MNVDEDWSVKTCSWQICHWLDISEPLDQNESVFDPYRYYYGSM